MTHGYDDVGDDADGDCNHILVGINTITTDVVTAPITFWRSFARFDDWVRVGVGAWGGKYNNRCVH